MRPRILFAAALAPLVLAGCADEPQPRWISLARGAEVAFHGSDAPILLGALGSTEVRRRFERRAAAGERWLETRLERADWGFDPDLHGGVWSAPLSVAPGGRSASGAEATLVAGERRFAHAPPSHDPSVPWRFGPGSFATLPGRLLLALEDGEEPPPSAVLSVFAGGARPADRLHLAGRRFSGDGFALTSGERVELTLDVPAESELRFATVSEPVFAPPTAPLEPAVFRVLVDGEERFRLEEGELGLERARRHVLALDEHAGRRTLDFLVEGGYASTGFLAPRIVPRGAASAGSRGGADASPDARPDLVVFLADTLRADVLAAYGGTLGLTANLDAFAREARVFRRAWSTGTYTLPAHASMFSGAFPHQVGIVGTDRGLPEELVTIAEHLREAGYRTGAITDSIVVSQALGLAQGFEWFDELHATLGSTLERAGEFLDDDDGRPLFLFVHTYRTHLPYRVSKRTREAWGERLGLEGDPDRLRARIQELTQSPPGTPGRAEAIDEALERIERFYRGGVVDLDLGFGRFLEDLRTRGLLSRGNLVFASDHGEAFGEHGMIYHRDKVYDVLARVPLLIAGRGVAPGTVEHAASLVDLPRTLCALAGVEPRAEWSGRSLLTLDEDRPAYVFECRNTSESTLAVVEGAHKLIGYERDQGPGAPPLLAAFDLAADPAERDNLLASDVTWPRTLLERSRAVLADLLAPRFAPVDARLDAERLEELRAMGYGGD